MENKEFLLGFIVGIAASIVMALIISVFRQSSECGGYQDKMIIEYHCPSKEYERKLIRDLIDRSGIQTNFVNKECTMSKWGVRYRLTNPTR